MKISEVAGKYVFEKLGKSEKVDAVDFKKMTYIDLKGQLVEHVQLLVNRSATDGDVKFFTITEE